VEAATVPGKKDKKDINKDILTKAELELRDLRLDLATVDVLFDKWYKEEENLSGALNMKLVKQKNVELR